MRPSRPTRRTVVLLSLILASLIAAPSAAQACRGADVTPRSGNARLVGSATLCLLNRQRAGRHLRVLRGNHRLLAAAGHQSRQMVARHFFDHVAPGGEDPVERMRQVGYISDRVSWSVGENIAYGSGDYATPRSIVEMWMKSPGHRANILSSTFREIGVGLAVGTPSGGRRGGTYTTEFGARG